VPSLNPSSFSSPPSRSSGTPISRDQRAFLIAKCCEEGISNGIDLHLIEEWLYASFGFDVDDVGDLTREQYNEVLEEQGWDA
jgi:hypothetical protein